jgi:ketosteroid isomerase-like protein
MQVIERLLDRTSALDAEGMLALFDDHIRFEHMFVPDAEPMIVNSKAELEVSLRETLRQFDTWHIWMTNGYRIVDDPQTVITEWQSEGHLKSGEIYRNFYMGIQRVENGKVVFWREYANPNPMNLVWTEGVPRADF